MTTARENQNESLTTQEIYRKPRILITDRDKDFLDWIGAQARNLLCDFVVSEDISGALLEASSRKFDALIISVYKENAGKVRAFAQEIRRIPANKNIPIAFILDSGAESQAEAGIAGALELTKPISADKLASTISVLMSDSFEHFRALVVSESPQATARLAHILEQTGIQSKFVLRPQRTIEFLYDFEPDVLLIDTELFGVTASDLSTSLRNSSRWDHMAILLFSSRGKTCSSETLAVCRADGSVDLSRANSEIAEKTRTISKQVRSSYESGGRDFLTGLSLRDRLYKKYIPQLDSPDAVTTNLSLAWLDINKLKTINENFGHTTGDRILVTLSSFLLQRLNDSSCLVCRWGGDELVVAVKALPEEASALIENAVLDFTLINIPPMDKPVRINAGIAHYPKDGKTVDELLSVADWRLHNAKRDARPVCSS
ncbi:MAG: diguanylate cyclase [Candidatus Obscuribacterales bacterium]